MGQRSVMLSLPTAVAVLATAAPARACGPELETAVDALVAYIGNPANCPPGSPCERPFAKAGWQLAKAQGALAEGPLDKAIQNLAKPISGLERAGLVAGDLETLVIAAVDVVDGCVAEVESSISSGIPELCTKPQGQAAKQRGKPDADFAAARLHDAAAEWSSALRAYGKALAGYSRVVGIVEEGPSIPCPPDGVKACRMSEPVSFTEGTGPCLLVTGPPSDTELCYLGVSERSPIGIRGDICLTTGKRGRFDVTPCDIVLETPQGGYACSCSGSLSTRACIDSAGWLRVSKISERLTAECPGEGRASIQVGVDAEPPSVSFQGGLLPVPPGSIEFCEGDVMAEPVLHADVALRIANLRLRAAETCTLVHTVEAIENRTVCAGAFVTVRIGTSVDCDVVMDGGVDHVTGSCTFWVADGVGFVDQHCSIDGEQQDFELCSVATEP